MKPLHLSRSSAWSLCASLAPASQRYILETARGHRAPFHGFAPLLLLAALQGAEARQELYVTSVHSVASSRSSIDSADDRIGGRNRQLGVGGGCQPDWLPTFGGSGSGLDGSVFALAVYDDGSGAGPALYVGGNFSSAGGVTAHAIVKWDGASWSALGSTFHVSALAVYDDGSGAGPALYAGGQFTTVGGVNANYIAKWDGTSWSALGSGMGNGFAPYVNALAVHDDGSGPALYAGGQFTLAGGVSANRIAKWDGTSWSAVGGGIDGNSAVHALAVHDDGSGAGPALYAGGFFTAAGGVNANYIAKWDGTSWSALGGGVSSIVHALAVYDDGAGGGAALYAGGGFLSAGGVVNRIARWDGTSWSALGSGLDDPVLSLAVHDDAGGGGPALYAGGLFKVAGGVSARSIARWDGASWSPLGRGLGGPTQSVQALEVYDDGSGLGPALIAGGTFTVSPAGDSHIARWGGCPPSVGVPYCFGDGSSAPCPCGNHGGPGEGCASSTGVGAVLAGEGTTSAAADDLALTGVQMPPDQAALLFAGVSALNGGAGAVFGDGLRCAGESVTRLGVQLSDALGTAAWGPGLGVIGGWSAGDTRYFQVWYRDADSSPCGTLFNLSHGYQVSFTN